MVIERMRDNGVQSIVAGENGNGCLNSQSWNWPVNGSLLIKARDRIPG